MKKILLTLIVAAACASANGQAGSLDQSFANTGVARADFGTDRSHTGGIGREIFSNADGSSYLVFNTNEQAFITRRLANGAVDISYGENGYSAPVRMRDIRAVIQPDGKIVVAGGALIQENYDFVVARFNPDGALDNSFSENGVQNTDIYLSTDYARDVAIQPDGKIIVVGQAANHFAVVRYNSDGTLDITFSNDGKLITDLGGTGEVAMAVSIQNDGKLVVAGSTNINSYPNMAVVRYLPNGTPDNSFSGDGMAIIAAEPYSSASALTVQADGKIVLAGQTVDIVLNPGNSDFIIVRMNPDGALDNSFSGDGKQVTDFGTNDDRAEAIILQPDGKLIAGGSAYPPGYPPSFALARYNIDGTPDNSFSGDGKVISQIGWSAGFIYSLALQQDAKILAVGMAPSGYAAARYNGDGSLDNSFDEDGMLISGRPGGNSYFMASAVQSDGKIVAAGFTYSGTSNFDYHFAVARYNIDGSLDDSFSDDGMLIIDFGPFSRCFAVAIQPDGKIIVAGPAGFENALDFALARINTNGTLDYTFSGDGKVLTDLRGYEDFIYDVAIQGDGKIVVAGSSKLSDTKDFALARYNTDGTLDHTFSGDGILITDFGSSDDWASSVLIQPDGKIIAAGNYDWSAINTQFALARYGTNGELDPLFDGDGKVVTDFTIFRDWISSSALQTDGKIVVAGRYTHGYYGMDFALARYNSDGSLDNSFSGDGKQTIDGGSTSEGANSVAVQADGKIIIGGFAHRGNHNNFELIRFNQDGTPDNSFSGDGIAFIDFGYGHSQIQSINIWNNRVYAVGSSVYGGYVGVVAALILGDITTPCLMTLTIPDTTTLISGVKKNTVYIGYAPAADLTLVVQPSGGAPGYSYLWSNGATTPSITVFPTVASTYSVTVTDARGCRKTISKLVNVTDVRCGNNSDKVLICHVPRGNPSNASTNCISANAVDAMLKNGSYLGNCEQQTVLSLTDKKTNNPRHAARAALTLTASPNPTRNTFILDFRSANIARAEVTVWDATGKLVEKLTVIANTKIKLGASYGQGIYIVELRQGDHKAVLKLIKLAD